MKWLLVLAHVMLLVALLFSRRLDVTDAVLFTGLCLVTALRGAVACLEEKD